MVLKNRDASPVGGFAFYYEEPTTGIEVRVPEGSKSANGLTQLTQMASSALSGNGMEVPPNLGQLVEHQICLRQPKPTDTCFSGGIGDDIHQKVAKPLLRTVSRVAAKVGLKHVAGAVNKLSGCSGCGGTKTYKQGANNLGRAGSVNKALNSGKFASNADHKRTA